MERLVKWINSILQMVRIIYTDNHCGLLTVLMTVPLVCVAHAGMFDEYLRRMVSVDAVVLTIAVVQIVCYLLIRSNWFRSITYYTDEEYALNDCKLYPTIDGIWDLWNEMKIVFFFLQYHMSF